MIINQISFSDKISWSSLLDLIYPIGSVYMSFENNSPSEKFGGTWVSVSSGYLRANSNSNSGGSNSKTLTIANLPAHNHAHNGSGAATGSAGSHHHTLIIDGTNTIVAAYQTNVGGKHGSDWVALLDSLTTNWSNVNQTGYYYHSVRAAAASAHIHTLVGNTANTGSGTAFSIEPQYQNIFCWHRTA